MSCYIVTFQAKELETRQRIRAQLKTYPSYCPLHNTCWAIVTDEKAVDVRDALKSLLQAGDRLFVIRSGTEGAWRNVLGSTNSSAWLKKNL